MLSPDIELQNTVELRATAWEIAAPKPDLGAKAKKKMKHFLNWFFKRQITSSKIKKICWQIIVAVLMQPLQYDLPCPAAKTLVLRMQPRHQATWQHHMANSHVATHMATEHDNNQSAITVRSATTGSKTPYNYANTTKHALQNTIKEPITHQNERPAPASHTGCPSSLAAATLHRKTLRFRCSGFLHNTTPIQHPCSHYNAFCNITWLTRMCLRTWQQTMATIYSQYTAICSQRFKQAHRTTHTWATTRCRTPREN